MPNDVPDWTTQVIRPDVTPSGSPWAYSSGTSMMSFAISRGVHVLAVLVPDFTHVSSLLVKGVTSGVTYLQSYPNDSIVPRPFYAVVAPEVDSFVSVSIVASAGNTLYVTNVADPIAVAIAQADAQPWQAPNLPPVPISFGYPGAAGNAVVIPAPAAPQSIWLHGMTYRWNIVTANSFGAWFTTGGLEIWADPGANDLTQRSVDYRGTKLPVATGLEFTGQGGAAVNSCFAQGTISYSVY